MTNSSITPSAELRAIFDRMTELDRRILDTRDINDTTTDSRDLLTTLRDDLHISADTDEQSLFDAAPTALRDDFLAMIHIIRDKPHYRDMLTDYALSLSICPLHFTDYAICFDDDDDECAAIRTIHPSHDT